MIESEASKELIRCLNYFELSFPLLTSIMDHLLNFPRIIDGKQAFENLCNQEKYKENTRKYVFGSKNQEQHKRLDQLMIHDLDFFYSWNQLQEFRCISTSIY